MASASLGERIHLALQALEGGAKIARDKGLDDDSSLRLGVAIAFATLGFSKQEAIDATNRVMATKKSS